MANTGNTRALAGDGMTGHTLGGYVITLWHAGEKKRHRYHVAARNHLAAVDSVLDHTRAPRSAVLAWEAMTPEEATHYNYQLEGTR